MTGENYTYALEFDRGGAWGKWDTCIRNGSEYHKGSEYVGDLGINGRLILK
jgi:hypothetical protein